MPFTLAHPIAAAPIWFGSKKNLDLPSLFVGSMIPDVDYFIALQPVETLGHTLAGVLTQGVAYSIAFLFCIRYVLRRPFFALIPQPLARKLPIPKSYFPLTMVDTLNVIGSIVLGAVSHLILDSGTHSQGWLVMHSGFLRSLVGSLPVYKILQYASGIIGVLALFLWLLFWLWQAPLRSYPEVLAFRWKLIAYLTITLYTVGMSWMAVVIRRVAEDTFATVFIRSIIGSISGLFLGLLMYSIVFWISIGFKLPHHSIK
jgi:Domain of unknown function (DUF4184)